MFGIGKKQNNKCFFCPKPAGKWKLEVNTSEGVLAKHICDECVNTLTLIQRGDSLRGMLEIDE